MRLGSFSVAVVLLLMAGCVPETPSVPVTDAFVVVIEGNVTLKRERWRQFRPLLFGTSLRRGDLLERRGEGRITIACDDMTLVSVAEGVSPVTCAAATTTTSYKGSRIAVTRGDGVAEMEQFPRVLAPRMTQIRESRPVLRWSSIPNANKYTVAVRGDSKTWTTDVSDVTEIRYPPTAPPLIVGSSYRLSVTAAGRTSDEEIGPRLGFTLMRPEAIEPINRRERQIRELGLDSLPTSYLLAQYLRNQELHAEAIARLEELGESVAEPAVTRLLGDELMAVGLLERAKTQFLRSLNLSMGVGDDEGIAISNERLAQLAEVVGASDQASDYAEAAILRYSSLGENRAVQELRQRFQLKAD
jgi:hypothetical protein